MGFDRPRDVPFIELEPTRDAFGVEREVDVNGVRAKLGPGVTRIRLGLKDQAKLRVTITKVDQPGGNLRGGGGFREIRIPGVRIRQPLRPPVIAGRALANRDLSRVGLSYVFERTTADEPFRRNRQAGSPQLELVSNREDAERQIDRVVFAPGGRSYEVEAKVQPAVDARDSQLDRLLGQGGPARFDSSGRFENRVPYRASSAFDRRGDTSWVGIWARPSSPYPWLSWRTPEPQTVSRLRLEPSRLPVRRPTAVRLSWAGGATPALRVAADGSVALPRPVRARAFRMTVVASRFPSGASQRERSTRAVGVAGVAVPGLAAVGRPAAGPLRAACGSVVVEVEGRRVPLRPRGTVAGLEAGRPLSARGCRGPVDMAEGVQHVRSLPGAFSVDLLKLSSPAPRPRAAGVGGGRVLDPGRIEKSSVEGVRVALTGPSWLVLGQSFSKGWKASCDGRDLGEPRPINGYANGWRAPADCRDVAFEFGPQSMARAGYLISAIVCLALLAFLAIGWWLQRGRARVEEKLALLPDARPAPMPLVRAAALAFAVTLPLAFLFAARSSVVIFPALTLIFWRGWSPRALVAAAAGLLVVVVPLLYALDPPRDRGGYNFEYSLDLIRAHWVTVAALVLLMVACGRTLMGVRRASAEPPAGPHDRAAAGEEPDREDRSLEPAGAGA